VLLALLVTAVHTASAGPSTFRSDEKIVGTYYFYWYDWNANVHIYCGNKDSLTHHPPDIQSFSYANTAWHRRELVDMMDAGIDFLLPVYWGDRSDIFWAIGGLDRLVEAELGLVAEGRAPPKIGMFFDTTALMVDYQLSGHPGDKPDLTAHEGKELFYGMIRDFYSHVPADLWARMDGAAVVWLYSSGWVKAYDQSLVDYVRRKFADDFNSTIFIVREHSWNLKTEMEYSWGAALGPVLRDVTAIGPGFDNAGAVNCYGQSPLFRDRLRGFAYRDDWERALRSASNIVVIETWNELHEGTGICETVELGRLYIDITADYSRKFKEGSWNRSLQEMDSLIVLKPQTLTGPPAEPIDLTVTIVNQGWRSWPERLDLGLFWLNLDHRNRSKTEVVTIRFPDRILTGQRYEEKISLMLPAFPGRYRILISASYLGKRLELEAIVGEPTCLGSVLCAVLAFIATRGPRRKDLKIALASRARKWYHGTCSERRGHHPPHR